MEDIPMDLAMKAFELCGTYSGSTVRDRRFPYTFDHIKGGLVCLKRRLPSKCQICNKVHDSENPFLVVAGEGKEKKVYFYCRRAPLKSRLYIGPIEDLDPLPPPTSPMTIARDNWTQNVVEKLASLANTGPSIPTVPMPATKQEDNPKHTKKILEKSNEMKWLIDKSGK